MHDPDSEAPTLRTGDEWRVFRTEALDYATRLERVEILKRKHALHIDRKGSVRARELTREFRKLANRFSLWEAGEPEHVALERPLLIPRLKELQAEADVLLASVPGGSW